MEESVGSIAKFSDIVSTELVRWFEEYLWSASVVFIRELTESSIVSNPS
jgi:hypothetical protein